MIGHKYLPIKNSHLNLILVRTLWTTNYSVKQKKLAHKYFNNGIYKYEWG